MEIVLAGYIDIFWVGVKYCSSIGFHPADFRYAHVLEPTNKRAAVAAERLRKLFQ